MATRWRLIGVVVGLLVVGSSGCSNVRWPGIPVRREQQPTPRVREKTDTVAKPHSSTTIPAVGSGLTVLATVVSSTQSKPAKTSATIDAQDTSVCNGTARQPAVQSMPIGSVRAIRVEQVDPEGSATRGPNLPPNSPTTPGSPGNGLAVSGQSNIVTQTDAPTNKTDVILRPGLVLRIDVHVLGKKEVEEPSRRVGEQGEITLPLLGVVKVAGRTIDELAADLQKEYSKFLVNPQVVVEFVTDKNSGGAMPWGYVTVLGRVKKSGRVFIPATRDLTISAAVQEAGGLDTSAKDTAIRLTRVNPDGTTETQDVNLRAVGAKGEIEGDVVLRPGDIVYVPELVF